MYHEMLFIFVRLRSVTAQKNSLENQKYGHVRLVKAVSALQSTTITTTDRIPTLPTDSFQFWYILNRTQQDLDIYFRRESPKDDYYVPKIGFWEPLASHMIFWGIIVCFDTNFSLFAEQNSILNWLATRYSHAYFIFQCCIFPLFFRLPELKGSGSERTIYKHVSDKNMNCLSSDNSAVLSVFCRSVILDNTLV